MLFRRERGCLPATWSGADERLENLTSILFFPSWGATSSRGLSSGIISLSFSQPSTRSEKLALLLTELNFILCSFFIVAPGVALGCWFVTELRCRDRDRWCDMTCSFSSSVKSTVEAVELRFGSRCFEVGLYDVREPDFDTLFPWEVYSSAADIAARGTLVDGGGRMVGRGRGRVCSVC